MSKLSLAGVSLVAAVPAGLVAWLLVDGFLNHFDKMPMALQAVSGLTLLVCALAVLLPPGVLVFGPKAAAGAVEKPASRKKGNAAEDEAGGDADLEEVADAGDDLLEDAGDSEEPIDELNDLDDAGGVEELEEEPVLEAGSEEFDLTDMDEVEIEESDMDLDDQDDSRKTRKK